MFCHKTTYLKMMQKIHHKTLRVIYQSDASYDGDLQQLSNSASLHQRRLRSLLTEIYKSTSTVKSSTFHSILRGLQFIVLTLCIFLGPQFGINCLILLNLAGQYLNLRMSSRKLEILTVGVWYAVGSTLSTNFHVILVTLYSIQLAGCYMICKNAENV